MAIPRASAIGNTYTIPLNPAVQQPVQQQFQDELGKPEDNLQQIDGVTDQYFDKWAQLKSFAKEAWNNYGIDVRYPDAGVPMSAKLNRIYLKAVADLQNQGNRLKVGQTMYAADRNRGSLINKDPNAQYYDELKPGTDIVDAKLDPIVREANDKLQQQYYGDTIKQAQSYYAETRKRLEDLRDNTPEQAGYWQRQLDSLVKPTEATKLFDPYHRDPNVKDRGKINAAGAFLKKVENNRNGLGDSFSLSSDRFNDSGEAALVSKDMAGTNYGGGVVSDWEIYPESKQSFLNIKFKDGTTQKVDMGNTDPMSAAKGFVTDNPRFASIGENLDIYADENGLFKQSGEVDNSSLLRGDADKVRAGQREAASAQSAQMAKANREAIKGDVDSLDTHWYGNDNKDYTSSDGSTISVKRNDDGTYKVKDPAIKDPKILPNFKKLSKTQVLNHLTKRGVKVEGAAPTNSTGTTYDAKSVLEEYRKRNAK